MNICNPASATPRRQHVQLTIDLRSSPAAKVTIFDCFNDMK